LNGERIAALLRIIIDGQAWLYAQLLLPPEGSESDHQALQDEWKRQTAELLKEILEAEDE
jgi:hypothetical protein